MELHLGNHDSSWLEPLKEENDDQTPRYKQISSPRIVFQNGSISRVHSTIQPTSPRQNIQISAPSTPRQNGYVSLQYSTTPGHSAHSSVRSSRHLSLYMPSRPLLRHDSSDRNETLVGTTHCRPSTFEGVRDDCLEFGKLYEDPVFPPVESSLYQYNKLNIKNIKWKRPHEIVQNPKFIVKDVCDMDVEPGKIGECSLMSAFTCLSMTPKLLQKCVPSDQDFHENYAGIFHFRFWRYGEWIDVVVDDRLPTVDGHILYMRSSDPEEFWPALLEKAYAKLYGCYEHIYGGRVRWALQDITGGITNTHYVSESSRHLLTIIDLAMTSASLVGAYISTTATGNISDVLSNGLKTGHTYCITGYAEIPVTKGKIVLLRLRNPWLNICWNGPWSRRSPQWKALHDGTKTRMNIDGMLDGEFWMSFVDFKNIFTEMEICHLGPESLKTEPCIRHREPWAAAVAHRQWRKGFNAGGCVNPNVMCNNSLFYVELDKPMAMIVSLMQKYKNTDDKWKFHSCSCLIYKVQKGLKCRVGPEFFYQHKVYANTKFKQSRDNVHTFVLSEGSYMILPVTEIEEQEGRYTLRFYTAGNAVIRELDNEDGMEDIQDDHSIHPEKIRLLRSQFKKLAVHNKYEEVDASELQSILGTKSKDKIPLLCCTSAPDIINFKSLNLSVETCKGAIAIFDSNIDGRLGYHGFNKLLSKLISWQNVFRKFAKGNEDFNSYSLRNALKWTGFNVSNKTLETLVIRFTTHGRVLLDEFICILIKLSIAHGRYHKSSTLSVNGQDSLLSELLHAAIYS